MKITYSGVISSLGAVIAVVVIAAHVWLFVVDFEPTGYDSFAYKIIALGCHFDVYAVPLLVLIIVLQSVALFLRVRELSVEKLEFSIRKKLQLVFNEPLNANKIGQNLMATSSFLLVIFFVSQMSYMVNHCQ